MLDNEFNFPSIHLSILHHFTYISFVYSSQLPQFSEQPPQYLNLPIQKYPFEIIDTLYRVSITTFSSSKGFFWRLFSCPSTRDLLGLVCFPEFQLYCLLLEFSPFAWSFCSLSRLSCLASDRFLCLECSSLHCLLLMTFSLSSGTLSSNVTLLCQSLFHIFQHYLFQLI